MTGSVVSMKAASHLNGNVSEHSILLIFALPKLLSHIYFYNPFYSQVTVDSR